MTRHRSQLEGRGSRPTAVTDPATDSASRMGDATQQATGVPTVDTHDLLEQHQRRLKSSARRRRLAQAVILIGLLASWEATAAFLIDAFWISSPIAVGEQTWEWIASGYIFSHIWVTMVEMSIGLIIGTVSGLASGILLGVRPHLSAILDPYVMVAFAIPHLALTPLLILMFGIGLLSKVALVAMVVFFFVFYNTFAGVRDVNADLINQVRIMGGGQLRIVRAVLLPSATSWILTGMRLALRQALAAAVIGEMIAGATGLGYLMAYASGTFDSTGVFAALVFVTVIAVALNRLAAVVEQHLTRWKASATDPVG